MKQEITLKEVYARLRECLAAVKPSDKRISPAMRLRLDYNIQFINAFLALQGDRVSDVEAIGFQVDGESDDEEDEPGHYITN